MGCVMAIENQRALWSIFQRKDRACGCPAGEPCKRCKVITLGGAEVVIDGVKAKYNIKHGSVRVINPPKRLFYRSGTPTGESIPGSEWSGSVSQFLRSHSKEFGELCLMGWATAIAEAQER